MKSPDLSKVAFWARLLDNRLPWVGEEIRREALVRLIQDGSPAALAALLQVNDPAMYHVIIKAYEAGHPEDVKRYTIAGRVNAHQVVTMKTEHGLRNRDVPAPTRSEILAELDAYGRRGWQTLTNSLDLVRDALKSGNLSYFDPANPHWLWSLLEVSNEPDRKVRANAGKVLDRLEGAALCEGLCRKLVEKDYPLARDVVVKRAIFPSDPAARALFFFMTDQWERYEALDLDQRLLSAAYLAEKADVQRRIREKLRATGRAELIPVVIGRESASRVADMTDDEYEFAVGMLQSHREWGRLWQLAVETTVVRSAHLLKILQSVGWEPPEHERALYAELQALLGAGLLLDSAAFPQEFPRALLRGRLRVRGRAGALAFAPDRPWLAIATGKGKVILWNYQTMQRERELAGFASPVGRLAFARDGNLVCAERAVSLRAASGVYAWDGEELRRMGQHQGPVTALAAVAGSTALSAGRDGDIALWDAAAGQQTMRYPLGDWPRGARVAPDGKLVMLLFAREMQCLDLADMRMVSRAAQPAPPTCGAFATEGNTFLIVGRRDGSVTFYRRGTPWPHKERDLCTHQLSAQGIETLPKRGYILTAGREGDARFFDLVKRDQIDAVSLLENDLISLSVSPDEDFLAVGGAAGEFTLWDLRGPDLAAILRSPLISLSPFSLGTLDTFSRRSDLEASLRHTLAYIALLLRHRIRFDIEVDTAPFIIGEFDIEL